MNEKESTLDNAVVHLMPIWDAITDLSRLRGMVALIACLTGPLHLKEDDEFEIFHDILCDINARLDEACDALETARQNVIFLKKEAS